MGQTTSSVSAGTEAKFGGDERQDKLRKAWVDYCATIKGGDASTEDCGCASFSGAAEYENSPTSVAKQRLIRDIASDLARELNLKITVQGKTTGAIVDELRQVLPDPRPKEQGGNRSRWSTKDASQVEACKKMAHIINRRLGQAVINVDQPVEKICEDIAEFTDSLAVGMQVEFAAVSKDTERIFKNLQALEKAHDKAFQRLEERIVTDKTDSTIGVETSVLRSFHGEVHKEMKRQLALLQSILNQVVSPTNAELDKLLKDSHSLKGFVRSIKEMPGTGKFGEKIAYAMTGLKTAAQIAHLVDSKLKDLGISRAEYAKVADIKEARDLIGEKLQKLIKNGNNAELAKFLKASSFILDQQYMHGDVVGEIKKLGGTKSGAAEPTVNGGLKLDKRVKARKDMRVLLLKAFGQRIVVLVKQVERSAEAISKSIGAGGIPVSDKLTRFVSALDLLPDLGRNVYFSLSGFYNDVQSRQERERYVSAVEHLVSTIDDLLKEKATGADHLRDMKRVLQEIVNLTNTYSDKFARGLEGIAVDLSVKGADEFDDGEHPGEFRQDNIPVPNSVNGGGYKKSKKSKKGKKRGGDEPHSGSEEEIVDGVNEARGGADDVPNMPSINTIADSLDRTKEIIRYYANTRNIRENLAKASQEVSHYGEDYVKVLADGVADAVDKIRAKHAAWTTEVDKPEFLESVTDTPTNANDKQKEDAKTEAKDWLEKLKTTKTEQINAQITMYHVAEATDLYMKAFTQALDAHPDHLKDIVRIIGDNRAIAAWFTESSGDVLAEVYESFPSAYTGTDAKFSHLNATPHTKSHHYYARVQDVCNLDGNRTTRATKVAQKPADDVGGVGLPGNPFLGMSLKEFYGGKVMAKTEDAIKISALKNLIATFINTADVFGGNKISAQIPMSPIQIYTNLLKYIRVSAFSLGLKKTPATAAGGVPTYTYNGTVPNTSGKTVGTTYNDTNVVTGVSDGTDLTGVAKIRHEWGCVAMNPANKELFANHPFSYDFHDTNTLFTLVIKSIIAKILTATGVYDLFNRPINYDGLGYWSGLRLIMGGGSERPKIITEALELYVRMPLLAEFYRTLFKFNDGVNGNSGDFKEISMVPEMEGTFTELISFIFDRARFVEDGGYSDTDIAALVEIINRIYQKFSKSNSPVRSCILEFVAEINRRYGIIKKEERVNFINERANRYTSKYDKKEADMTDFELEGLDEDDTFPRPMPSQSYENGGVGTYKQAQHKHSIELETHTGYIKELRGTIHEMFKKAEENAQINPEDVSGDMEKLRVGKITLNNVVHSRTEELKYAKSEEEKFAIVVSAINSLGQFAMSALEKSLVAFHETVIAPLATVNATYNVLKAYRDRINQINSAIEKIKTLDDKINVHVAKLADPNAGSDWVNLARYVQDAGAVVSGTTTVFTKAQGTPGNMNITGLIAAIAAAPISSTDKAAAVQRFLPNQQLILFDLFETLYCHAATLDKLVNVRIEVASDGQSSNIAVNVEHSAITEMLEALLNSIKKNINKFRGLLPKEIIKRYEETSGDNASDAGTLYYLEKNLMEILVRGHGNADVEKNTLDSTNLKINETLKYLNKRWNVGFAANSANLEKKDGDLMQQHSHKLVATAMLYGIAPFKPLAAMSPSAGALYNVQFGEIDTTTKRPARINKTVAFDNVIPDIYSPSGKLDNLDDDDKERQDIFTQFNRLLAAYVCQCLDVPSKTLYQPLLDQFANGAFGANIMGSIADNLNEVDVLNDSDVANITAGAIAAKNAVLARSLAESILHIMTDRKLKDTKFVYLQPDLAEVPLYVKERLRAELPIFDKMFSLLIRRSDMLKDLVRGVNVGGDRDKYLSFLDKAINGTSSLRECAKVGLKDIGDEPKIMELNRDFIQEYRGINATEPFMPSSSLLALMSAPTTDLLPHHSYGSPQLKMHYATRAMSRTLKLTDFAGIQSIIKGHNQATDAKFHLTDSEVSDLIIPMTRLAQYIADTLHIRKFTSTSKFTTSYLANVSARGPEQRMPFSLKTGTTISEVIRMTESNNLKDQRRRIVLLVDSSKDHGISGDRKHMIVYNIIDLNIVPINVHALMREIPLVNLYNYSWTFDNQILQTFVVSEDESKTPKNAKQLFAGLLVNPYMPVSDSLYEEQWAQIVRGDLGFQDLAQPKYIGQEVYNKVLFGEIYPGASYASNASSASGHADLGGRKKVLADGVVNNPSITKMSIKRSILAALINHFTAEAHGYGQYAKLSDTDMADILVLLAMSNPSYSDIKTAVSSIVADPRQATNIAIITTYACRSLADPGIEQMINDIVTSIQSTAPGYTLSAADMKAKMANVLPHMSIFEDIGTVLTRQTQNSPFISSASVVATDFEQVPSWFVNRVPVPPRRITGEPLLQATQKYFEAEPNASAFDSMNQDRKASLKLNNPKYFTKDLHYVKHGEYDTKAAVQVVAVGDYKELLQVIGKMRFDTVLCRNLLWLSNIQRAVLLKVRRDAAWNNSNVVGGPALLAPGLTELYGNDTYNQKLARRPGNYKY
jgi:hypothetical protein